GPVSEVNATANSFTVLGTSVLTNEATIFDGLESLADLNEDDRLVIHGFADNEGNLFATRVERDDSTTPSNEVRVTGTVTNRSDTSFQVNGVRVLYNAAAIAGVSGNAIENGMRVRVSGTLSDDGTVDPTDPTD